MSSEISTDRGPSPADAGFQPWHFFLLLSMVGATIAVARADVTHPAALLLLSAAVVAAGMAGLAAYRAFGAFFGFSEAEAKPLTGSARDGLEREKALTLRSIKELEFDRAMGKIGDQDFHDMSRRLKARALALMEELERAAAIPREEPSGPRVRAPRTCAACGTSNDTDARFCKQCGKAIA